MSEQAAALDRSGNKIAELQNFKRWESTDARGLKARHCTFLAPDAVTDVLLQNDDVRVRVSGEEWQLLTSHVDLSPTFGPLVPCRGRLQRPG